MRFHSESQRDCYDAVVIGSGIGGLTSAALLARAGLSVLVVERHDRVGGCCHSFRRGRYLFDSAVHIVGGCEPVSYEGGGLVHQLLSALGVRDQVEFERVDPCYEAVYPGLRVAVPGDLDGFVDAHAEHFPKEGKGLRLFVQECLNIRQETRRAADFHHAFDVSGSQSRFPTLLKYRRATLQQVLDEHVEDPRLRALLGTLWPYLGLPPSQVSFVYFAAMLMSYVADGAYYCKRSFQHFSNTLADCVRANGGEVLLRSSVRRITVEEGRATGVVLENGQRIAAGRVLSNADAIQTVNELVGAHEFGARYRKTMGRMKPSISAFVAYLATDLALDAETTSHETFCFPSTDHDRSFAASERGEPDWVSLTVPTLADPSLAPEGQHLLMLTTLIRHDSHDWREAKAGLTERLVGLAEGALEGLSDRILFSEGATPRTIERYTRNTNGALYGWELSPRSTGPGRPATQTPIQDLHLVGHWTQPGGGVYGVVNSGIQVARSVLGCEAEAELWAALASDEPRRLS